MTRVSVLLPVFDAAEVVGQAVANILSQTRPPAEIVLADDGSRDWLSQRLPELRAACARAGVALVETGFPENRGRGAARNLALAAATGALIAWYDVDDLWAPEKLERQVAAFERLRWEHPEGRLLVTCSYLRYTRAGQRRIEPAPTLAIDGLVALHHRQHIQLQTILGPREVFLRLPFDVTLNRAEDFDFALRFASQGGKVVNPDPDGPPLVHYFRSPANGGAEAAAANQRVVERSAGLFRVNHVDPEAFLAAKIAALRRVKDPETEPASDPDRGVRTMPSPCLPLGLCLLPDGELRCKAGGGEWIARSADWSEIARGHFGYAGGRAAAAPDGRSRSKVDLPALFMAGARQLEVDVGARSRRFRVERAPSGQIRLAG